MPACKEPAQKTTYLCCISEAPPLLKRWCIKAVQMRNLVQKQKIIRQVPTLTKGEPETIFFLFLGKEVVEKVKKGADISYDCCI